MTATTASVDHRKDAMILLRNEVFDLALERLGIPTIAAAADYLDTDPGTIYRFRRRPPGIRQPSGDLMLRWAEKLRVSVETLWDRSSDPPPGDANPTTPPPPAPRPPSGPKPPKPSPGPGRGEADGG